MKEKAKFKKKTKEGFKPLSLKLPLWAPDDGDYKKVKAAIQLFRSAMRRVSAMVTAVEVALCERVVNKEGFIKSEKVTPERVMKLLQTIIPHPNKDDAKQQAHLDIYIKRFLPGWRSTVYQEGTRRVQSVLSAKDAENGVPRRFLIRNGDRSFPLFNFESMRIVFSETVNGCVQIDLAKRQIGISWIDGDTVWLKLGKDVDPWQWRRLKMLEKGVNQLREGKQVTDDAMAPAGFSINIDDKGRLSARFGYYQRIAKTYLDPERVLDVGFSENAEEMIQCSLQAYPSKKKTSTGAPLDSVRVLKISAKGALDKIDELKQRSVRLDGIRESAGALRKVRTAMKVRGERLSAQRDRIQNDWNHQWSRMIVKHAVDTECGTIAALGVPETMLERPWKWAQLKFFVEYKAQLVGIKVTWDTEKAADKIA